MICLPPIQIALLSTHPERYNYNSMKEIKKVVAGDVKTPVVKTPVEVKAPVVNEVVAPDKKELKATIEAYKLVNPVKYEIKRKNGEFDRLLK